MTDEVEVNVQRAFEIRLVLVEVPLDEGRCEVQTVSAASGRRITLAVDRSVCLGTVYLRRNRSVVESDELYVY